MTWQQWVLIIDLALAGLVIFGRGCAGSTHTYTIADGVFGLAECVFLIWLVTSL